MKYGILMTALVAILVAPAAMAFDKAGYKKLATEVVQGALGTGEVNVDALIAKNEQLMKMGIDGCREYAAKDPANAKLMQIVIDNADAMKAMTLEEIEPAWHEGEFITKNGVDFDAIDHFSPALSHMDTVVHPATAIIALRTYKASKDPALLSQVKDEISEVLEHVEHLE